MHAISLWTKLKITYPWPTAEQAAQEDEGREVRLDGLLTKPTPFFNEPLEMLKVCHECTATQCITLVELSTHLPLHGAGRQARQTAWGIMRYFSVAGPHHHADEEEDLFPLLMVEGQHLRSSMIKAIVSLLDKHWPLETSRAQLRAVLVDITQDQVRPTKRAWTDSFTSAYRRHIAVEEDQVLVFVQACLNR